jgi:NADH-quinone oxidoreductase subunit I
MQALTNRAKLVDRRPMTALERIYLWNILKGMAITFRHIFKRKATINYPEQKRSFSAVFRGLQILNRDRRRPRTLYGLWFMCGGLSC